MKCESMTREWQSEAFRVLLDLEWRIVGYQTNLGGTVGIVDRNRPIVQCMCCGAIAKYDQGDAYETPSHKPSCVLKYLLDQATEETNNERVESSSSSDEDEVERGATIPLETPSAERGGAKKRRTTRREIAVGQTSKHRYGTRSKTRHPPPPSPTSVLDADDECVEKDLDIDAIDVNDLNLFEDTELAFNILGLEPVA